MILAAMLERSEDSLICDLAETYHIYDMRSFKASYIAILAAGLREDSRVMMLFSGSTLMFADFTVSPSTATRFLLINAFTSLRE